MPKLKPLPRSFFNRNADAVARDLIGCLLIRKHRRSQYAIARIVETEAYVGTHDLASHASKGKTKRNAVMFGPPGFAYVYFIYGMYDMFNVVTSPKENPQAVLIRALEPLSEEFLKTTNGPGKLTRALNITRTLNGADLCSGKKLWLSRGIKPKKIRRTPRIGVDYAGAWKNARLRFLDPESSFVSKG